MKYDLKQSFWETDVWLYTNAKRRIEEFKSDWYIQKLKQRDIDLCAKLEEKYPSLKKPFD